MIGVEDCRCIKIEEEISILLQEEKIHFFPALLKPQKKIQHKCTTILKAIELVMMDLDTQNHGVIQS